MIRHSTLTAEEKKRIIVDSNGILKYENTRESMRLLGSKFFQELQGASRGKTKTYDIHNIEEDPDPQITSSQTGGTGVFMSDEMDEEQGLHTMLQQGDEDATLINEFEDQIIEAVQESEELSSCFSACQQAKARLPERARHRGFWPLKPSGQFSKGKGYGAKKGQKGKGSIKRPPE